MVDRRTLKPFFVLTSFLITKIHVYNLDHQKLVALHEHIGNQKDKNSFWGNMFEKNV